MNTRSFGVRGLAARPAWVLAALVATAWGDGTGSEGTICASGYKMSGRASREWSLELSGGGGVFYRQGKSELLQSLSVGGKMRPDSQVYETGSGRQLTVRWDRSACRDARDPSKVFVSVEFEGDLYQGCGQVGEDSPREGAASTGSPARAPA